MTTYSSKCTDLVKSFEGLELTAYKCPAGIWTVGYGSTLSVFPGLTITQEQADARLTADLLVASLGVKQVVKVPLTQGMFDALTSFVFNLGIGNLKSSSLLKKLNAKDYEGAASEFGKWVHAGKKVLPGLVKRREAERQLFLSDGIPT